MGNGQKKIEKKIKKGLTKHAAQNEAAGAGGKIKKKGKK